MITGNKGEWSEIYTLLKVISDGTLYAGDSNLNLLEGLMFPVIRILRDESSGSFIFSYEDDLVIIRNGTEEFRIPVARFHAQAAGLLTEIRAARQATFSIPETERFINSFRCVSLKASSSVKSDIRIVIHDLRTGTMPELGFSIKSQLGGASTLLNAGRTTNFIYEVSGEALTAASVSAINAVDGKSKIRDRLEAILRAGGRLRFNRTESPVFGNNLVLIDSALPAILAEIVFLFFTGGGSKLSDLVSAVSQKNPAGYDMSNGHPFYEYKIKRFLTDIALGMMPSRVWSGELDATGGYLVVKESGDVLCYHIYNRNEFESYLLKNTKLETASSSRHGFGSLYEEGGVFFINLNLQIRFIK